MPGGQDGVGDYALTLAGDLRSLAGWETVFLSAEPAAETNMADGFRVCSPLRTFARELQTAEQRRLVLHYVNYGYARRGTPLWLPGTLRRIKGGGKLLTVFHELYASGSIRQSAFWLQPVQKRIVRLLADISEAAIVSNGLARRQLERLAPSLRIYLQPMISNFGEPQLSADDFERRDPTRWVICGGTELVERSVHSFVRIAGHIPKEYFPKNLSVFGGRENPLVAALLENEHRFESSYHPNISRDEASRILSGCAFGWIDYFARAHVPIDLILKSTAFAACCAHGVLPVMLEAKGTIEDFPGTFCVGESGSHLPTWSDRAKVAEAVYQWYQQRASSLKLAAVVNAALADFG